jgi:hypothetical protein
VTQALGQFVVAHVVPERLADAAIRGVVQDQEIADALVELVRRRIELATSRSSTPRASGVGSRRSMSWMAFWIRNRLVDSSGSRKPLARPIARQLRFHGLHAAPGAELQQPRLAERAAVERRQQRGARLVLADELRREHVAVAGAVLQRDAPDPAALLRGRTRERREIRGARRARPRRDRRAASGPVLPTAPNLSPSSSERKPLQSTKKSPEICLPDLQRQRLDIAPAHRARRRPPALRCA